MILGKKLRNAWLLIASLVFYSVGGTALFPGYPGVDPVQLLLGFVDRTKP